MSENAIAGLKAQLGKAEADLAVALVDVNDLKAEVENYKQYLKESQGGCICGMWYTYEQWKAQKGEEDV